MSGHAEMVANFQEAGFTDEQAERGARMMESGRYFGFADAATSLAYFGHGGLGHLTEKQRTKIPVIEQRTQEGARGASGTTSASPRVTKIPDREGAVRVSMSERQYDDLMARSERLKTLEEGPAQAVDRSQIEEQWAEVDAVLGLRGQA